MTGTLIVITLLLLLVLGLQPAHRRSTLRWRPGLDLRNDRDHARLSDDLQAAAQQEPDRAVPSAVVHLAPPRNAATDHRLASRNAA